MSWSEQPASSQSGGGKSPSASGVVPWRTRHTVRLKVFDLSKGMAKLYGGLFVSDEKKGVWHTNVVVFGLEYFYMSTICVCPAGLGWPGEEHLTDCTEMGTTERTPIELEAFLRTQQQIFTPDKYDMFKHNCNHFSDLVLRFLGSRRRVPSYILSLPDRVLQTTLGKLVHPILSVAMDVMKADIRQKADKAELSGEIFFYGGVEPLLDPTESRTRRFLKQVARQVQQERRTHRARHVNSSVSPLTERALSSGSSVSPGYKPFPSSFPSPAAFGLSLTPISPLGHARQCCAARAPACGPGAAGLRRGNRPSSPAGVSVVNEASLFCLQQELEAESSLLSPGVGVAGDMEGENREATKHELDESARLSSRHEGGDEVLPSDSGDKGEGEFLSPGGSSRRALDRREPTATRTAGGDTPARFPSRPSRAPSASRMHRQNSRHLGHRVHPEDDEEAESEPDAFWDAEEASANSGEEWTVLPGGTFASGTRRRETSAVEEGRCFGRAPPDWLTNTPHGISHFTASGHTFSGLGKAETPLEWAEAESDGGAGAMRSVFSAGEREDEGRKATGEARASDSDSEHSIRSYTFEDSCPLITAAGGNSPRPSGASRGDEEDEWQLRGERRRRVKAREGEGRVGRASGRRQGSGIGPEIDSGSEGETSSRRLRMPQRTASRQDGEREGRDFQAAQDVVNEGHQTQTLQARSQVRRSQSEHHARLSSSSSDEQAPALLHARAASGEILFVTPPEQAQRDVWSPPHGSEACSAAGEEPKVQARVRRSREGRQAGKGSELEYSDAHGGNESFSEASRDEGASSFLVTSSASHAEDEEEGERSQSSWEEEERSAYGETFDSDGGWSASPVKREDDENVPFEKHEREEESGNDQSLAFEIPGEPRWGGHAGRKRREDVSWLHANPTTSKEHAAQARRDVLGRRKDEEKLEADFERLHASFFTPPSGAPVSSDELEEEDAFSCSYPSRSDISFPSCTELARVRSKIHRQRTAASSSSTVSQLGALHTVLYRTRSPHDTSVDVSSQDNRRGYCSGRVNHASDPPASVFACSTKRASPTPIQCGTKEGKGRHQSRSRLSENARASREFESSERRR
ncbi:UNVERIFIED_CONTAM: DUF862 domain-containing protein [Hammondia hammondi]|eukprot:XP_008884374.1 DUF862 domain-containing protein [Hammondia hammondi]